MLGFFCLVYSATLFYFCNYAHYFANVVRYQKTLYEVLYVVFVYVKLQNVGQEVSNKLLPPCTKYECFIPGDWHSPSSVRTVTTFSCALAKLL
jgi:DNA phosphorothioation-dependent restriction protein DptG